METSNVKILTFKEESEQYETFIHVCKDCDVIKYKLVTPDINVELKDAGFDIEFKQALRLAEHLNIPLLMDI